MGWTLKTALVRRLNLPVRSTISRSAVLLTMKPTAPRFTLSTSYHHASLAQLHTIFKQMFVSVVYMSR